MNEKNFKIVKGCLSYMEMTARSDENLTAGELLARSRITPAMVLSPMQPLFLMYGVPCFYRGELVAACGKAKSGKTLFLSIIMAAALTEKVLALERHAGSDNADDDSQLSPLRVLWLDTEQSQQSTQDILVNRIIPLCRGDTVEAFDETFFAYNLRGLGFEKRLELTKLAIGSIRPDLMIVDGVKDLMTDINDVVR